MWSIDDIVGIVREAGSIMKGMHASMVEAKEGHSNFVTECDKLGRTGVVAVSRGVAEQEYLPV